MEDTKQKNELETLRIRLCSIRLELYGIRERLTIKKDEYFGCCPESGKEKEEIKKSAGRIEDIKSICNDIEEAIVYNKNIISVLEKV